MSKHSRIVMVSWDDPDETPLEAIARLNTEAIKYANQLRAAGITPIDSLAVDVPNACLLESLAERITCLRCRRYLGLPIMAEVDL